MKIIRHILILLLVPFLVQAQSGIKEVDCNAYLNDTFFKHTLLSIRIDASLATTANIKIAFTRKKNDTVAICTWSHADIAKGFTNLDLKPGDVTFKDKTLKAFYTSTGYFLPGNYLLFVKMEPQIGNTIQKEFKLKSEPHWKIENSETKTTRAKKEQLVLHWKSNLPDSIQKQIAYHLIIARINNYLDTKRPVTQLKNYQWIPNLRQDSISVKSLPVSLKSNKFYTYYIEAYYNDVLVSESPHKIFLNRSKPEKKVPEILAYVLPKNKSYKDLEVLLSDTSRFSAYNKRPPALNTVFDKKPGSKFSVYGSVKFESQVSDITTPNTQIPPNYARVYINPGIQMYDLPVSGRIMLTTENNTKYNLNSFDINFDIQKYKDNQLKAFQGKNLDMGNLGQYSVSERNSLLSQKDLINKQITSLEDQVRQKESFNDSLSTFNPKAIEESGKKQLEKNEPENILKNEEIAGYSGKYKKMASDSLVMIEKNALKYDKSGQDSVAKLANNEKAIQKRKDSLINVNPANIQALAKNNKELDSTKKQLDDLKQKLALIENTLDRFQKTADKIQNTKMDQKLLFSSLEKFLPGNKTLNKVLSVVDQFNIGRNYPSFSPLTLSGIAVDGVSLGLSNKLGYVKSVGGNTLVYSLSPNTGKNFLTGFKGGIGQENGNHIAVSLLNITPVSGSAFLKNQVVGTELQYILFKNFKISGEFNKSFTSGKDAPELPSKTSLTSPEDLTKDNANTAYVVKLQYFNPLLKSNISLAYKAIEKNYLSEGAPYLRTDITEYEAKYEQPFFHRKFVLNAFYRTNTDNRSKLQAATTNFTCYGISGDLNIKNLPQIHFSVNPYQQSTASKQDSVYPTNSIIGMVSAVYSKRMKLVSLTTTACYSIVTVKNNLSGYNSQNFSISEQAIFKSGFATSLAVTLVSSPGSLGNFMNYHCSIGGIVKQKWNNALTADINTTGAENISRYTLAYETSYTLDKKFRIQLQAGQNYLNNLYNTSGLARQYFIRTGLTVALK